MGGNIRKIFTKGVSLNILSNQSIVWEYWIGYPNNLPVDRNIMIQPNSERVSVLLNNSPKDPAVKVSKKYCAEVIFAFWDRWYVDIFEPPTLPEYTLVHVKGTYSKHQIFLFEALCGLLLPRVNKNPLRGFR